MGDKVYSIDELRNIVTPIAEKYGVGGIYLFGSYARGEATPTSDIDLRVDKGKLKGFFQLGGLYHDIESALQKKVDVLTTGSLDAEFLNKIHGEEVVLYAG